MEKIKKQLRDFGSTRIVIIAFLIVLLITAALQGQNMATIASDIINRFGMNLFFALAMVPAIISGTGLNFGITIRKRRHKICLRNGCQQQKPTLIQ